MTSWNWQRIGLVAGAALAGALATVVPASWAITAPVIGTVTAGQGLGFVAVWLTGWAQRTPGHVPAPPPPPAPPVPPGPPAVAA